MYVRVSREGEKEREGRERERERKGVMKKGTKRVEVEEEEEERIHTFGGTLREGNWLAVYIMDKVTTTKQLTMGTLIVKRVKRALLYTTYPLTHANGQGAGGKGQRGI